MNLFDDYQLQRQASEFVRTKVLPKVEETRLNNRNCFQIKEVLAPALLLKVKALLQRKRIKISADSLGNLNLSFS